MIVWAVIFDSADEKEPYFQRTFSRAKRFDCCEAVPVAGGEYELTGAGIWRTYSVIVRIYFGSRPTLRLRNLARQGLAQLKLPRPRLASVGVRVGPGQTRTFTKAELKPGMPVRCTIQGHTLLYRVPGYPAGGGGVVSTPRGKQATHLNVQKNADGSYTVSCGFGGHHF